MRGAECAFAGVIGLLAFCGRGISELASCCDVGSNGGIPPADRALWIAAADGTVGMLDPATPCARTGLNS